MRRLVAGVAVTASLTLGFTARAEEAQSLQPQTLNLSSAVAGCYVDTPAFDVASSGYCFAVLDAASTTALAMAAGGSALRVSSIP